MMVEFYGLPATGKSTAAQDIARRTRFPIITIESRRELLLLNVLFFLKHPITAMMLLYYIIRHSQEWAVFYFKFMNSFLHRNAKYERAQSYTNALIVEGYFQNIVSVFERALTQEEMKRYLRLIPKPDLLVLFDISENERMERLMTRARDDVARHTDLERKEVMKKNDQMLRQLVPHLSLTFFLMDTQKSVDELYQHVHSQRSEKIN